MQKNQRKAKHSKNSPSSVFKFIKLNYTYLILIFIMAYYIFLCKTIGFVQDDTYITLKYAKNFANGNGLVFNLGEHVEGFTSLIWVLFLSLTYKLGSNIENISQILSVTFGAISLLITYFLFNEIANNPADKKNDGQIIKVFSVLSVLITALSGTYYYWSVSGMETSLFTMFFLITIYLYLKFYLNDRLNVTLPIIIFLTSLIRPEGTLLFVLVIVHFFFLTLRKAKFSLTESVKIVFSKNKIHGYLIFLILFISITIFRIIYFGYPFPNTFYAKTSFSIEQIKTGLEYFISFASDYLFYGFILIVPIYLIKFREKIVSVSFLYLNVLVFIIYIIFIGGDVLTQYRFFVPIIPLINILFCLVLYFLSTKLNESERKSSLPMLVIIPFSAAIFINIINSKTVENIATKENTFVETMKLNGLWLKAQSRISNHKISVAASTIGALSYYSDVYVLDMLGLTDSFIAHHPENIKEISDEFIGWKERKYNAKYILDRKPDYILFSTQEKPSSYAERALFAKTNFHTDYFVYLYDSDKSKVYSNIYKKRDNSITFNKDSVNHNPNYSIRYISQYNKVLNFISSASNKITIDDFIKECKELIKISPSYFGDPYRLLAWAYSQLGEREAAIENAKLAISIEGINLKASILLISAYLDENDFVKAEVEISKIEKIIPEIAETLKRGMLRKKESLEK